MTNILHLHTIDKTKDINFEKSWIYSEKYDIKLKKNTLHTLDAVKLFIEYKGKVTVFILSMAIISVDENGDIFSLSNLTYNQSIFKQGINFDKKIKEFELKIFSAKKDFGLNSKEEYIETNILSEFSIMKLLSNNNIFSNQDGK